MDPKLRLADIKREEESLDNEAGSGKKRYFASDEDFEDFCIAPYAVIKETESGVLYYTGEYSEEYLECIENDTKFVIRDEDSVVYKRQCACKRVPVLHEGRPLGRDTLVQLSVENLEPYFGD